MSVIFGIINKKGVSVELHEMEQMYASLKHFPHDNYSLWNENNVGFGWVQLYDTPESIYDKQPFIFGNERYVLIGKARLDNRNELCDIFNINKEERKFLTDTKLLQFAFEKWGNDCSKKLFGDWSFAIWDKNENKLFIARDHQGVSAIYYSVTNNFIAFASNKTALFSIPVITKEVNKIQLAQLLVGWNGYANETLYKNILRLPPARSAIYFNGNIIVSKYWQLENVSKIKLKNDDEYVEAFNEFFFNAVKSRIRSNKAIGSMLSGGIDSSSVTSIAAIELATDNKKIFGYTSIPKYDAINNLKKFQFGDESLLAGMVSKKYPNIIHEFINSENINPLSGIVESVKILNSVVRNSSNLFWLLSIFESAKKDDIGILLTGQGGNFTISWPFRGYYSSFIKTGLRSILRKKIPEFLIKSIAEVKHGEKPYIKKSFINKNFEKEINLLGKMKNAGFDPHFLLKPSLKEIRLNALKVNMAQGAGNTQELGDYFGLNIYDPTLDIKLLEFCFAIPDKQFVRIGHDRFMIRRAMKNILPEELLFNEKKGVQSSDLFYRVKENIDDYIDIIKKINDSAVCNEIMDVKKMNSIVFDIKNNSVNSYFKKNTDFLRAINVGIFLLNQEK